MKSADIVSRERLGETVGNLIEGVDVDKAEPCHAPLAHGASGNVRRGAAYAE